MDKYLVAYAKITTNKNDINLQGVYFGGMGDTIEEANNIAKDCVNQVNGGTILPKVVKLTEENILLDTLMDISDKFEAVTLQMQEANKIIIRTQAKK